MTNPTNVLRAIVSSIDTASIPAEYIMSIELSDTAGTEHVVKGTKDIRMVLENRKAIPSDIKINLNDRKIMKELVEEINLIYREVNSRFAEDQD